MANKKTRGRPGPALTIGIPTILAAFAGSWGYQHLKDTGTPPGAKPTPAQQASAPITFKVAADPWSGYSTFRDEPRLAQALRKDGITLDYQKDEKYYDQNERMRALAAGEIDVALTTLDAFLQNGAKNQIDGEFPGVIAFGIDESSGGDAIFVAKGKQGFDDVLPTDKVCYAVATPSEHLWDFASLSFASLGDNPTDNGVVAEDCWKKLESGAVQVAVLWQPFTAIAVEAGYTKVFATGGQADDVILDIGVVNRKALEEHPAQLGKLVSAYYKVIDGYQKDRAAHAAFVTADCGPDCRGNAALGDAVLDGIDFLTFEENLCIWFGHCATPGKLAPRVLKTAKLLVAKGKLAPDALPPPESLIDDRFVVGIKEERLSAARLAQEVAGPGSELELPTFAASDPNYEYTVPGAEGSDAVGTLRLPNINFKEGSYALDEEAKATVLGIAEQLRSFPASCVRIAGHTNSNGDPVANKKLSRFRAMAIAAELSRVDPKAFPPSRFDVQGYGSERPLLVGGVEDSKASRRTEFTLLTCDQQG